MTKWPGLIDDEVPLPPRLMQVARRDGQDEAA